MTKVNTIGVDLAKNVIQSSVVSPSGKELQNRELTRIKFAEFLVKQKPALVAFEACATAHYWARYAQQHGHQVKIIPAKAVAPFRQGHKTDKNDALAVAEAANRPNIKQAPLKTVEQQGMQSIQRSREMLVHDRTAISNHIRGLLLEFGVVIPQGWAALEQHIPRVLEDAENGVPHMYRPTLHRMFERYHRLKEDIAFLNEQIKQLIKQNDACRRLMDLEGVGPISAILLFATLGTGEAFLNGREFSAYVGLTPKQYSSGGKTNLIGISKHVANRRLRAVLIQGARAYVHRGLKDPQTPKQKWLWALIERAGCGKAAVALANKNVRTAWALLTKGTAYNRAQAYEALAA
jgi:transposase